MILLLIRAAVFLASAAIGLLAAALLVDGMTITVVGFLGTVVVFAVIQSVLAPFISNVASRSAPALLGAAGLVSTFIGLLVASAFMDGLTITGGVATWVLASVVVWLVTMVATLLLPIVLAKAGVQRLRDRREGEAGRQGRKA